jgi:succinate dehydrogenase / fumarate reductase, cytochrome b subunit
MESRETAAIPQAFVWRRLHSLMGLWLSVYVIFHLLTNSQAALFIGDDGKGFIHSVNSIHELPYLPLIEIAVLAFPILVHLIWGIKYLFTAEYNSFGNTGRTPYLPEYPRNHAYTWQRITAWLLIVGIIAHVVHMRLMEYPLSALKANERMYMVRVSADDGLHTLSARLGVELYDEGRIQALMKEWSERPRQADEAFDHVSNNVSQQSSHLKKLEEQAKTQEKNWIKALSSFSLKPGEVVAAANNFGTADLLMLRNTFKSPFMIVLYTLLVLTTCFHAFNGVWTFMIKWGVTLTERSQRLMRTISTCLMIAVALLGLSAVWLTYWVNLKQ